MFKNFRQRLLFWFLVFIGSNIGIIALTALYLDKREDVIRISDLIDEVNFQLLHVVDLQQRFFSYDTKSSQYFETGESNHLDRRQTELALCYETINRIQASPNIHRFKMDEAISESLAKMGIVEEHFGFLVDSIQERGFKDHKLEGSMRYDAHWLETAAEVPEKDVLSLRRHEKDFMIRNERSYVQKFAQQAANISSLINEDPSISESRKSEILNKLDSYSKKFNRLVDLDTTIGIKDNTGLKRELDLSTGDLQSSFDRLRTVAQERRANLFAELNTVFLIIAVGSMVLSVALSYVISKRITVPLVDLTEHITRFVDSNFTLKTGAPVVRSKDEIGKLTENFYALKEEVISRLEFFKQKVDDRTKEVADANRRLLQLNQANSRFVPEAFLKFMGKESILDISKGDQVEREMAVMFTDIRDFTSLSESMTPQENFDFVNDFFREIIPVIEKRNGVIDKFMGDSVLALFPRDPIDAVEAGLEFRPAVAAFNESLISNGREPIRVGVGIHFGSLILGTVGHENRLETTVISDAVNIASRVEGLTKHYNAEVIVTESVVRQMSKRGEKRIRFLDTVKVKGKTKHTRVYQVIHEDDKSLIEALKEYDWALECFENSKLEEAKACFEKLSMRLPEDEAIKRYLSKCEIYLRDGLPEDWKVSEMRVK